MNFRAVPKKVVGQVPAAGPLAGTSYDFRELFPDLAKPADPRPAARVSKPGGKASRRSFFRDFTPKKAKP